MTTIPYILNGELIDLVPKLELDKALADNAELLERLEERTQSHLLASARDVQTIQQQAIELSAVKAALSGRTVSCSQCNESARTIEAMREAIKDAHAAIGGCLKYILRLPLSGSDAECETADDAHHAMRRLKPFLK
jgi:formylmethanofuran dehydrogenase subunit E